MRPVDRAIADDVLARHVAGYGVSGAATLASVVDTDQPVLVVFLRHYG